MCPLINCEIMISAIKSDNPIELLNYISNTFPKVHSRVRFNNIFALLTYSLIQSATQAVTQSISLSHCRTGPPSHCSTVPLSVGQSVSVSCRYSVTQSEANASPGPLPESEWRTSVYLISLLIVALPVLYIFIRFSSFTFLLPIKM